MSRISATFVFLGLALVFFAGGLRAQIPAADAHDHMAGPCPYVPKEKRPEFGCWRVAASRDLKFSQPMIYWHLRTFTSRAAADAAKSPTGIVIEEDGRVWLSEFGSKEIAVRGGDLVAVVGPLELLPAKTYDAEIAYAVLRPGDRTPAHTHAGPEAWYMIAGQQCLETPEGIKKAGSGETMSVKHSVPMELSIIGTNTRRSLTLVIHDSAQGFGTNVNWKPTGACGK